jgi:hypothetical protein
LNAFGNWTFGRAGAAFFTTHELAHSRDVLSRPTRLFDLTMRPRWLGAGAVASANACAMRCAHTAPNPRKSITYTSV